jgi:hypothetical protein
MPLISCQFFNQITGARLFGEVTTSAPQGATEAEAVATVFQPTPTQTSPPSDPPPPTETNTPIQTPTNEPTATPIPTEAPPYYSDQRISIVLDDTRRMQELPEEFDQPPADSGKEYLVFYLTVTEIKDVLIIDIGDIISSSNPPIVVARMGKEYPAKFGRIENLEFLDPTHLAGSSKLVEGSECIYAFDVPKGIQPKQLLLTYKYQQEIEDQDTQTVDFELDLTESDLSSGKACQIDDGQQDTVRLDIPFTANAVTIDGEVSPVEWDQALCIDLRVYEWGDRQNGEMFKARWQLQYDQLFIYYLVRVPKEIQVKGTAMAYFWPKYDGTWPHSDGFFVDTTGFYQDHSNWDESDWHKDETLSPPGSVDVVASVTEDDAFYWFEIRKALDSRDGYDWSLEPGDIIGKNPKDTALLVLVVDDSDYYRNIQMALSEH